jgi:hypothetical protein
MIKDKIFDILFITSSPDHVLISHISKRLSAVLCVTRELQGVSSFYVIDTTSGQSFKYCFPTDFSSEAQAKILGEVISKRFGIPRIVDFDFVCKPHWLATYFNSTGASLISRYSPNQKLDRIYSSILGSSDIILCNSIEEKFELAVSQVTNITHIGKFDDFNQKAHFYTTLYSKFLERPIISNKQAIEEFERLIPVDKCNKKILIINYFYPESTGVGAARTTFWHENIDQLSEGSISAYLLTSNGQTTASKKKIVLKDETIFCFPDPTDFRKFINKYNNPVSLQASTWTFTIYCNLSTDFLNNFDYIIISGNPFFTFNLSLLWKSKNLRSKIVLDYRDPFSENTRYKYSSSKRDRARDIELQWNNSADKVITVNHECKKMVIGKSEKDILVIPNGYSKKTKNRSSFLFDIDKQKINFVYAGSIYKESILPLIQELDQNKHHLHMAGRLATNLPELSENKTVTLHGLLPHGDVLNLIGMCDICVLMLSGFPFVSTTKIYDYILYNKQILALSTNPAKEATFLNDFSNYKNKVLIENEREQIKQALNKLDKFTSYDTDISQFSRSHSTKKLIEFMERY